MSKTAAISLETYYKNVPVERQEAMKKLRKLLQTKLPKGFEECMSYGFPSFSVPHSLYPAGYHCDTSIPLPFISIASQKNFIALYHMGIYADPELMAWFTKEYPKHCKSKLDMGKSCIRFKKMEEIPYELIGELLSKMSPKDWINRYEKMLNKK